MNTISQSEITTIKNLLVEAGLIIASDYTSKQFTTNTKSDGSFITSTDVKIQEYLVDELSRLLPDYFIIAEELNLQDYPIKHTHIITLDPLA